MELFIIICAIPIVFFGLSVHEKLKKTNEQNKEIIELLRELKEG